MKKIIFLSVFTLLLATSFAQPITRQSIEDSVFGWMKVYKFKSVKVGMESCINIDAKALGKEHHIFDYGTEK